MNTAILYHANCVDGFTAAWAIDRATVDSRPVVRAVAHGEPMPADLANFDKVYIVDFAYPHADLSMLADTTEVVLLDHHESAMLQLLADTGNDCMSNKSLIEFDQPYKCVFDMNRSGAGIAWDFISDHGRPDLVNYVEDRDLWRNHLSGTREVSAYLRCLEHDLELWDHLASVPIEDLVKLGRGVVTQLDAIVRSAVDESYMCEMGGRRFPITNVVYTAGSDTAAALCEHWDTSMAGYYFRQGDGRWKYGFRSRDGSTTVHDFAAQFGGGGHPSASGAVLDRMMHESHAKTLKADDD